MYIYKIQIREENIQSKGVRDRDTERERECKRLVVSVCIRERERERIVLDRNKTKCNDSPDSSQALCVIFRISTVFHYPGELVCRLVVLVVVKCGS